MKAINLLNSLHNLTTMKAIQEVNSGKLHVQEAEMRENDKKITEQKRKLDDLSMVLERNVCSKSSHLKIHHQQYGNTTQHYSHHRNYSNNYNHNNYHAMKQSNGYHNRNTHYNHIPRARDSSSMINNYKIGDKKYLRVSTLSKHSQFSNKHHTQTLAQHNNRK